MGVGEKQGGSYAVSFEFMLCSFNQLLSKSGCHLMDITALENCAQLLRNCTKNKYLICLNNSINLGEYVKCDYSVEYLYDYIFF